MLILSKIIGDVVVVVVEMMVSKLVNQVEYVSER